MDIATALRPEVSRQEPEAEPQPRADDAARLQPLPKPVARVEADRPVDPVPVVPPPAPTGTPGPAPVSPARRGGVGRLLTSAGRHLATAGIALVAIVVALLTWQDYVTAPWTRNGNVRVQVASIAPQVSGQIVDLKVVDNQFVHAGDVLYVIDPFDFEVAVRTAKASVDQEAADLQLKQVESERRQHLSNLATTPEEQQTYAASAAQAKAAFEAAQQQLAQAELNLKRTSIVSPVNGYVTNLLLRVGDFALTGQSNISVIDSDSFWIDGYFEETKMARICVDDRVEAKLMGYSQAIVGHVDTITRGISVGNAASGPQGLPNVDPIYTWVRLAQRVPVRIAIDQVPPNVPLVSGMTATVSVRPEAVPDGRPWFDRTYSNVASRLIALVYGPPPPRQDCLPVMTSGQAPKESVPVPTEPPALSPEKLEPGLAPGMDISPGKG